jgi:hypothetical protein
MWTLSVVFRRFTRFPTSVMNACSLESVSSDKALSRAAAECRFGYGREKFWLLPLCGLAESPAATLRLTGERFFLPFGGLGQFLNLLPPVPPESCAFATSSSPDVVCRTLLHSLGASRHRTFPQLNFHRARVRRNHGRLLSNGFIERAPDHRARSQFFLKARLR